MLAISAVLVLLTVYLALFFAPLPQASVKTVGEIMPSMIGGPKVAVVGFVCASTVSTGFTPKVILSIADFRDYGRFRLALSEGHLDEQWWEIRPIDIASVPHSPVLILAAPTIAQQAVLGTNLSVVATVTQGEVGPNSIATGFYLFSDNFNDFTFSSSPTGFGVMSAPIAQKIFYFHMPSAWASYIAFGVTLVGSAMFLRTRDVKYDRFAFSSAEIGVLFATIAILTGPIWAKQEWGVYWRWDDTKLTTTFILWLVYIGYLSLRAAMSEPSSRARVSAVYGILGFVTVPMSLLSARIAPLLRSSHPEVIASSSGSLSMQAGITIGVAVIAFTLLFITMLIKRVEVAESEEELEDMKRKIGEEE